MISLDEINLLKKIIGNSFYIVSQDDFAKHFKIWESAFKSKYDKFKMAYSYKTNYLPILCKKNKELGGLAEVVSDIEYEIASSVGVSYKEIVFNGPLKSTELSANVIANGGIVNVDSYSEAKALVNILKERTIDGVKIGIRCNIPIDGKTSRFGIPIESKDFFDTVHLFNENNIQIGCLHCHIKGRSEDAWRKKTEAMICTFDSISEFCSQDCCIDLGGSLPALIDCDDASAVAMCYAEVIAGSFRNRFNNDGPTLIVEPGTALAAPSMSFVTTAISSKTINGESYITLSASSQNIGSSHNRNPKYLTQIPYGCKSDKSILCGYTCLEDDIICDYDRSINIGDTLIFNYIGAYSIVLKPPFIMPNFPVLAFDNVEKRYKVVRKAQDLSSFCTCQELDNL